jgi:hypothetical protein
MICQDALGQAIVDPKDIDSFEFHFIDVESSRLNPFDTICAQHAQKYYHSHSSFHGPSYTFHYDQIRSIEERVLLLASGEALPFR